MNRYKAEELAVESAREKLLEAEKNLEEKKDKEKPVITELADLLHSSTCSQDHVGNCVGVTSSKLAYAHDYEHTKKRYFAKAEKLIDELPDFTIWQIARVARLILN